MSNRAVRRHQISPESRPGEEVGEDDEVYEPAGPSYSSLLFSHTLTRMHAQTHTRSVHLLLVNQFGGVHKVLAIKQDDGGCDRTSGPPEHHVSQRLRPRVPWKTKLSHLETQYETVTCSPSAQEGAAQEGFQPCFSDYRFTSILINTASTQSLH